MTDRERVQELAHGALASLAELGPERLGEID